MTSFVLFHNEGSAFNSTKPSARAVTSDPLHSVTFDKVGFLIFLISFFLVVASLRFLFCHLWNHFIGVFFGPR